MRAISITVEAFGPYAKRQTVDFRELGYESVFLITGPTGAGKTSVFDAMVYALYGRASGSDRDQDTLRSHFAEVEQPTEVTFIFDLKDKRYEVVRAPKQLKKKVRGEGFTEQPPRAELYEIIEGEKVLLSSKINDVNEAIEDMLHLDYEQFRKMVMIPQGEFRRLISENSKEREEILQKIFQTYVYEHITSRLKEESKGLKESISHIEQKEREEIQKLHWSEDFKESITSSSKALEMLEEDLNTDKSKVEEYHKSLKAKRDQLKASQEKYYKDKQVSESFQKRAQYQEEFKQLQDQEKDIKEKQERVQQADQAEKIRSYEEQAKKWKQEKDKQQSLAQEKMQRLEETKNKFSKTEQAYQEEKAKENEREKLKESLQKAKQDLTKVKQYQDWKRELASYDEQKKEKQQALKQIQSEKENKQNIVKELSGSSLESQTLSKQFYEFEAKEKELQEGVAQINRLMNEEKKLSTLREQYQNVKRQFEQAKEDVEKKQNHVKTLEDQLKQHQAVSLAAELSTGEACPVCGSTEHPSVATLEGENVSDRALQEAKANQQQADQHLQKVQDQFIQTKSEGQSQRHIVEQLIETLSPYLQHDAVQDMTRAEQKVYWENQKAKRSETKEDVGKKIQKVEQQMKQAEQAQNAIRELETKEQEQHKQYQLVHDKWLGISTKLEQLEEELPEEKRDASGLQQWIEKEEERYNAWLKSLEELYERYEKEKEQRQKLDTELAQQQGYVKDLEEQVQKANHELEVQCKEHGFETLEAYRQAKLPKEELEDLRGKVESFLKKQQSLQDALNTLEEELRDVDPPQLDKQLEEMEKLEKAIQQLTQEEQQIQMRMRDHERVFSDLDQYVKERKASEEKYYYMGELAELAKGDNAYKLSFERYVLSAFLDEIIIQANIRLDKMTDHRYQLERSQERAKGGAQSGLDLEVIDHYTGQKRSVKTLSGGEGFKAALSLALGMADVIQAHAGGVQLDTLFIDEGFGTLDEASLEQAIDTLKDLQQGERMLGIISHVPQLKDEIRAKLHITPSPNGSSLAFSFQ